MIDWQCTAISEPLVLQCILNALIGNYIKLKILPQELSMCSCHSQVAEREKKLVSEACGNSSESDGCIIAKLRGSRMKIPQFKSKKDFKSIYRLLDKGNLNPMKCDESVTI